MLNQSLMPVCFGRYFLLAPFWAAAKAIWRHGAGRYLRGQTMHYPASACVGYAALVRAKAMMMPRGARIHFLRSQLRGIGQLCEGMPQLRPAMAPKIKFVARMIAQEGAEL